MMQKCKKLLYFFTVLLLIGFTGTAYAAFELTVSTDVKTIPATDCDQAGSYTMTAQNGAQMREGDTITYRLTSTGGSVSLCKTLDYFLVFSNDGTLNCQTDNSYPVFATNVGDRIRFITDAGVCMDAISGAGTGGTNLMFGLLVQGTTGNDYVTATARVAYADGMMRSLPADRVVMTYVGTDPANRLSISLFDEKNNQFDDNAATGTDEPGFRKLDTAASGAANIYDYDVNIDPEDNALCLNTSAVTGTSSFVEASPESSPSATAYKLNFTGTYRIALVQGSLAYTAAALGKSTCLPFTLSPTVDQLGNVSSQPETFDPGTWTNGVGWVSGTNVCSTQSLGRGIIITKGIPMVVGDQYRITLTVMSMASGGTAYASTSHAWMKSDASGIGAAYWTIANNSNNSAASTAGFTPPAVASPGWSTIGTAGEFTVDPPTATESNYTGWHSMRSGWLTVSANCGTGYNEEPDSIMLDVGTIWFDYNNISEGETIGLRVAVEKFPCGTVVTEDICLGVAQTAACDTSGCRLYASYLTNAANTAYWSGMAITNLSATTAGSATLVFYDTAGGTATKTLTLAANAIEIAVFNSAYFAGITGSTIDTSLNMRCHITSTNVSIEAQTMIGGADATAGIYGYAPRNSCFEDATGDWSAGL